MARRRDEELLHALGAQLRRLRVSRGLTQERLAEAIGVRTATISRFETGDVGFSITTLGHLSEALGVEISELVDVEGPRMMRELTPGERAHAQLLALPDDVRDRAVSLALAMVRGARAAPGAARVLGMESDEAEDS